MLNKIKMSIKIMFQSDGIFAAVKILVVLITALTAPLAIYIMQRMIEVIEQGFTSSFDGRAILFWLLAFAAVKLWEEGQSHVSNMLDLVLLRKLKVKLLPAMVDKVNRIAYGSFENAKTKDIFYRLENSPHEMVMDVFQLILGLVQNTVSIVGVALVFARVSWWFMVIFAAVIIPSLWLDCRSTKAVNRMHNEQTFAERELSYYEGLLSDKYALHELRVMNSVDYVQEKWMKNSEVVLRNYMGVTVKSQVLQLGSTMLLFVFSVLIIGLMIYNLYQGNLSVSIFVALVSAIQSVGSYSYDMAWAITRLGRKSDQMQFLKMLFAIPEEIQGQKELEAEAYEIRFENVCFSYPGTEKQILKNLSFCIRAGEKVSIVGRNGAGKSTIIKLLCGLYRPDSGTIRINGVDIAELSKEQLKKVRSVVFQDYGRFYSTIRENVAYGDLDKLEDNAAIGEALEKGMIFDFVDTLSQKMDTQLGNLDEDGIDLSGGQWQKIAIARACLCKSRFLILDEPTAALDPIAESQMYETLSQVLQDHGYIFISHRLASAKMAERILVIDNGRIIEDGDHEELMARQGLYCLMFKEQSAWYVEESREAVKA